MQKNYWKTWFCFKVRDRAGIYKEYWNRKYLFSIIKCLLDKRPVCLGTGFCTVYLHGKLFAILLFICVYNFYVYINCILNLEIFIASTTTFYIRFLYYIFPLGFTFHKFINPRGIVIIKNYNFIGYEIKKKLKIC